MFCTSCGKAIEPKTKFCPECGAKQVDVSSSPASASAISPSPEMSAPSRPALPVAARSGKLAVWGAIGALVLVMGGGVGYWGWNNKVARDEAAAQKLVSDEAAGKLADAEQRRVAAEKTAEAVEIKAAQVLLAKHIAVEEAEAQAQVGRP
jgi:hypothetical protein